MTAILLAVAIAVAPKIDVLYPPFGTIDDRGCGSAESIAEAGKLRATLQAEWDVEGPKYFSVVLRRKYANEHPIALNHLHVMALEKLALTGLVKTEELKYLDEEYRSEGGHYKRAWEIVNDIEDYRAFIKELQGAASSAR